MTKIAEIDQVAWQEWVDSRPPVVKAMCERLPPDRLYRMKSTGQRVTMIGYSENRTVRVSITGQYNAMTFDREVFGIDPDDLEECDLPPSDEPIGTLLTEQEDVDALLRATIAQLHDRGEKHNEANCHRCFANDASGGAEQ
jgi:hypothetical protein